MRELHVYDDIAEALQSRFDNLEADLIRHVYLDGVGLPDFASWYSGGRIVPSLTSEAYTYGFPRHWYLKWWWWLSNLPYQHADYALSFNVGPANCWPMRGRNGTLGIALARPITISAVTIDHLPKRLSTDLGSAPKEGELWGLLEEEHDPSSLIQSGVAVSDFGTLMRGLGRLRWAKSQHENSLFVHLISFTVDADRDIPFQTFAVPRSTDEKLNGKQFRTVIVVVRTNWGQDKFTCLYRVRVHSFRSVQVNSQVAQ